MGRGQQVGRPGAQGDEVVGPAQGEYQPDQGPAGAKDPAQVEKLVDASTRLVYSESVGNPRGNVDDFDALAGIAHRHGLPFVIDNTFSPPPVFNPFAFGCDIIVYSLTKMIGGHGVSIGGAVVEKGDFDWKGSGKFPEIASPDPSYHGVNFWEAFGPRPDAPGTAFAAKVRHGVLRNIGAGLSPFNSWTFIQGIETLPLRARRHCENALTIAKWLAAHPRIDWVEFAGLPGHPDHARAGRYMPLGPGAVFCFGVKGGYEAGKRFIDSLRLLSNLANILDAKSLVIHPASTTHQQLSDSEKRAAGIRPELIRISVGLEDPEDIKADIDQALGAAAR
jgi:O-acetylhomoserine (thiol)-lyase